MHLESPLPRSIFPRLHGRCLPISDIRLHAASRFVYDVTFENVQAGLRTDYLFRLANQHHGLVVGTGDLSELGLGWCTYGVGDHMSHYNVNASVPKTLIEYLIRFVAGSGEVDATTARLLGAILATEISPELVPAKAGEQIQSTERMIGPYALQDFNLFYLTRYGFRPSKIAFLGHHAWSDAHMGVWPPNIPATQRRSYSLAEIRRLTDRRFPPADRYLRAVIGVRRRTRALTSGSRNSRQMYRKIENDQRAFVAVSAIAKSS